ncbi:MAG: MATE family efflux transporter [Anaerolineae bacterium]|nr:MATE family efflux transporter [Anaerolineae bacterium]
MNVATQHPFLTRPRRTVLALTLPVVISQIAEPLTGLVDTAFVARLGAPPLAALGVGGSAISLLLWTFYFLGISTMTEVAQAFGRGQLARVRQITSLGLLLAGAAGVLMLLAGLLGPDLLAQFLGAAPEVHDLAVTYIRVRLLGAPAVLLTMVGFGALRGLQDMRTPLRVAVIVNVINILLDLPFIYGLGPLPALGVAGAALASVIAQYLGLAMLMLQLRRRPGLGWYFDREDILQLLRAGRDLVVRSGLLTVFLLLSTRVANQIGPEAGAAHQAMRTLWLFGSWLSDAFGTSAQSLVGYFLGAAQLRQARRAAAVTILQGLATGVALCLLCLLATSLVREVFVPPEAAATFNSAWLVAALTLPLAALAFVTDGIHWGTGDYPWLRNGMIVSTGIAAAVLLLTDTSAPQAFLLVWLALFLWLALRSLFGLLRIWPGHVRAPLRHMRVPEPA